MELLRSTTRAMSIQRSRAGTQLDSHSPSSATRSAVAFSSTSFATGEGEVRRSSRSARDTARSAVGGETAPGGGGLSLLGQFIESSLAGPPLAHRSTSAAGYAGCPVPRSRGGLSSHAAPRR